LKTGTGTAKPSLQVTSIKLSQTPFISNADVLAHSLEKPVVINLWCPRPHLQTMQDAL